MHPPQGHRVTEAKPFSQRLTMLPTLLAQPTSEEAAMIESQKHIVRRHAVPKHVHESRPIEGVHVVSTPKIPDQIFEVRHRVGARWQGKGRSQRPLRRHFWRGPAQSYGIPEHYF